MSCAANNFALSFFEKPFKIFVKETGYESVSETKKDKFNLGFEGNEAQSAYEEIIFLEGENKSLPQRSNLTLNENKSKKKVSNDCIDNRSVTINNLFKAVESGDKDFVFKYFNSENVNISDQFGWTPLMSAAYSGHIEIVDFLLKLGANTEKQDKSGFTVIHLAQKKNHIAIINLIKRNIRKNKKKIIKDKISDDSRQDKKVISQEKFFCETCKIFITESTQKKHESSTLHIFNTNPKVKDTFYGIPKCNRGYQMLLNRGWDEESGLGPSGEGQKYPVKTVLKRDRKGLGRELDKKIAKVTHFNPRDTDAVKFVNLDKRKAFTRKDRQKQLSKEAAKTRALRQALS